MSRSTCARRAAVAVMALSLLACEGTPPDASVRVSPEHATPGTPTASGSAEVTSPVSTNPRVTPGATVSRVLDDSGAISIEIPDEWQWQSMRWMIGNADVGPLLIASPNADEFVDSFLEADAGDRDWSLDGAVVGVSTALAEEYGVEGDTFDAQLGLAEFHAGDWERFKGWENECIRGGVGVYEAPSGESGFYTNWFDCGEVGTILSDFGATDGNGGHITSILVVGVGGEPSRQLAVDLAESIKVNASVVD